ncbi:fungal-specific transcription factor domain-containing protein [Exophiala viscosa]|uniref:fungal-specific transcription factor domain-containing protein n=1 Tax=Exophiala viscosa TaxID=2486360 RepID=UPI00219AA58E|nr:fungal-specific transcription factor domain-containing protein [Exophiala viscosa]
MATSAVLPPDSQLKRWHDTQHHFRPCPTVQHLTRLSLNSTPSAPMAPSDGSTHKTRLPSFGDFLSGASHDGPSYAQTSPGSSHGDGRLQNGPPTLHRPPQATLYGPPERHPMQYPPQTGPQPHTPHAETNQEAYWAYANYLPPDGRPALSGMPPSGPPFDLGYGRSMLREEVVADKGLCYVYDDGTVCQKVINGDAVNPKWGTTKAGKPRKRLGQACNTCREKKIKCDPSVPKCAQCLKFGRECKFDSMSRAGSKQAGSAAHSPARSSPSAQIQDAGAGRRGSNASADWMSQELARPAQRTSMTLESLLSPTSEDGASQDHDSDHSRPAKKARRSPSPHPVPGGYQVKGAVAEPSLASLPSPTTTPSFSWHIDPVELDRGLTVHYVRKYLSHVDAATYWTLPRQAFLGWVTESASKSSTDKMLLYAMMAMGTVFARRPDADTHRSLFTGFAEEAIARNADTFSLQLLQTRLILALLAFSQGQYNKAWDLCGSAVRTGFGLKYNTEEGVRTILPHERLDFHFDYETLVECRRRTFWSAYIMDCFNGCCSATVSSVYRSQCHLRLPCTQVTFESGHLRETPFSLGMPLSADSVSRVGLLGFLVEIATIFHEVVDQINQTNKRYRVRYSDEAERFRHNIMNKLETWESQLQTHLERVRDGDAQSQSVSGLYILHYYTALLVNRYVRHGELDQQAIAIRLGGEKGAYKQAQSMLELVQQLSNDEEKNSPLFRFATTSPFIGFAITVALDVITASGTLSDLMDHKSQMMSLISSGLEALESLVDYWHSAGRQRDMIKRRLGVLLSATKRASDLNGAFYFGERMQSPFPLEQDIVYGLGRVRYFQALGWAGKIHDEGDFHRLDQDTMANRAH